MFRKLVIAFIAFLALLAAAEAKSQQHQAFWLDLESLGSVASEEDIASIIASHIQMREHYEPILAMHGYYLPPLDLRDDDLGPPMIPNHCDDSAPIPLWSANACMSAIIAADMAIVAMYAACRRPSPACVAARLAALGAMAAAVATCEAWFIQLK
jgi:hypothetical protein